MQHVIRLKRAQHPLPDAYRVETLLDARDFAYCLVLTLAAFAIFLIAKSQVSPIWQSIMRFDGRWYSDIAASGYPFTGNIFDKQNLGFLPLEGGAIAVAKALLPGQNVYLQVALLGVATLFGTLVGLFMLVPEYGGKTAARMAALLWAFSPVAFYHFVGYTEPLFALATVWCLVSLQRGWMWFACVIVGLCALGRAQAVVLAGMVGVELLRRASWRPWRMLRGDAALKFAIMAAPLMLYATWLALRFGDSALYVNALQAFQSDRYSDGDLSFFPAVVAFFSAVSSESPVLLHWTSMLTSVALFIMVMTAAVSSAAPWRWVGLYLGFLAFLFAVASFDKLNFARWSLYLVPWVAIAGVALARLPGGSIRKHLALVPYVALASTINFYCVMRFYRDIWVS